MEPLSQGNKTHDREIDDCLEFAKKEAKIDKRKFNQKEVEKNELAEIAILIDQVKESLIDKKKLESQKNLRLKFAPRYLDDLEWPEALNALLLEEALEYELTSFFEQVEKEVELPPEACQLFIKAFDRLYNRPFHEKNLQTLETFFKKLKEYISNTQHPDLLENSKLKSSIRGLNYFCIAKELSGMTVGEIRQSQKLADRLSDSSHDFVEWEIAKYTWSKFDCIITSLIKVIKNVILDVDDTLNVTYTKTKPVKKNPIKLDTREKKLEQEVDEIFKKLRTIKLIVFSRTKMWKELYETILNAFQFQQPRAKEITNLTLNQLQNNIILLKDQIEDAEFLLKTSINDVNNFIEENDLEKIENEVKSEKNYFLFDEEDKQDNGSKEKSFYINQLDLYARLFQTLSLSLSYSESEEELRDKLKNKYKIESKNFKEFESFFSSRVEELGTASLRKNKFDPNQMSEKSKVLAKKFGFDNENLISLFRLCYRKCFSVLSDLKFCSESLENFLNQLEIFKERFDILKLPTFDESEDLFDFNEQQENQILIKCCLDDKDRISEKKNNLYLNNKENLVNHLEEDKGVDPKFKLEKGVPKEREELDTRTTFSEQLFHLPFLFSAHSKIIPYSSFTEKQKKIIKATYQDVHFHLNILGSLVDLINENQKFLPYFAKILVRSLSIVAEQDMTAELLSHVDPYDSLQHSHLKLANRLDESTKKQYYDYLKDIDYGVVLHRYPFNPKQTYSKKSVSLIAKWLIHPESVSIDEIKKLMTRTFQLVNRHEIWDPKLLKSLEVALHKSFDFSFEIKKQKHSRLNKKEKANPLILKVIGLLQFISQSKNNLKEHDKLNDDILLNIEYHAQGLLQSLECLLIFPQTSYLLVFGDNIFMHLQHLDELFEAYYYVKHNGERLYIHDLKIYRELRGYEEKEYGSSIAALNCGSGDHYPHRYQLITLLNKKTKDELPMSVRWRLDALDITLHSVGAVSGFVTVLPPNNNRHFENADNLRNYLLETTKQIIESLIARSSFILE